MPSPPPAVIARVSSLLLLILCAAAGGQESASDAPREAQELIPLLGDESFAVRQGASQQLAELGLDARDALVEGLEDEDSEVRRRCRRLLERILREDYQRRLAAFEEGRNLADARPPAGWERFRELAGEGDAARKLFVAMHKAEGPLLISAEAGPQAAAEALVLRYQLIYQEMRTGDARLRKQPAVGSVAAMLLMLSDESLRLPSSLTEQHYWSSIINSTNFRAAMADDAPLRPALQRLFGAWLLPPCGPLMAARKLQLARQYPPLPEGLELALSILRGEPEMSASYRSYAIELVGKLGNDSHRPSIAGLLDDEAPISRRRVGDKIITIEVRDVALGWLVHLTGQDLDDYHLPRAKTAFEKLKENPRYSMSYAYFSFSDEEERKEALARWNGYVAAEPLSAD